MGIRGRLVLLIVGVMTASLVFGLMNLYRVWQLNHERLTDSLRKRAEFGAIAFDQWVNSQKEPLAMLAEVANAPDGSLRLEGSNLQAVLDAHPQWQSIEIVSGSGSSLVTRSKGELPPESVLDSILKNAKEKKTTIVASDRTVNASEPIFTVGAPTPSGGAIVVQIDGQAVKELFDEVELAEESVVAVMSQDGQILYRRSSKDVTVTSEVLGTALIEALGNDRNSVIETESPFDGVNRVYGIARTEISGNVVIIGTASDRFYDPLWQQVYGQLRINAFILLAAIGVALLVSYSILRSLRSLKTATYMFAVGNREARAPQTDAGELGELGKAFNWMAGQINEREEQLRELDRLKSEFVSNVSHELKTPLTTIKTLVHVLDNGKLDDRERKKHLDIIAAECDRQIALVSNVLDLSQIESGKLKFEISDADVTRLLTELVAEQKTAAGLKGISFDVKLGDKMPTVKSNLDALRRVFRELTDNAIKYTPDGGTINVSAFESGNDVVVAIEDNGCGIHSDDLAFVFDKFFRARPNESASDDVNSAGGAGLGLFVSKTIIEEFGGSIVASPSDSGGTIMTVRLPRERLESNG